MNTRRFRKFPRPATGLFISSLPQKILTSASVLWVLASASLAGAQEPELQPAGPEDKIATTRLGSAVTMWEFNSQVLSPFKATMWNSSFTVGRLARSDGYWCSGAMISPHLFMTAAHCGGPGWMGSVNFFRIDEDSTDPGPAAQRLSPKHHAVALPWTSFAVANGGGDTQLWWLDDDATGVPPGIQYGYLELSGFPVAVGEWADSFWVNPVQNFRGKRLDATLLYSSGRAETRLQSEWRGPTTSYGIYGAPGSSGSPVIGRGAHGHRVVGITSCAPQPEGPSRCTADTDHFLARYDADENAVLDAVEYDWLTTRALSDFYRLGSNTPTQRSLWRAAITGGPRFLCLSHSERCFASVEDGTEIWHGTVRFAANGTYRIAIKALGESSYLKLKSERDGREQILDLPTSTTWEWLTERVTLDDRSDYRLYLGSRVGGSLLVEEVVVVREDGSFDFESGAERSSWEYHGGGSHPTSWGLGGTNDFSGVVVGPCHACLRSPYPALLPNTAYELRFTVKHVSGSRDSLAWATISNAVRGGTVRGRFGSDGQLARVKVTFTTGDTSGGSIAFGTDGRLSFMVDDIELGER